MTWAATFRMLTIATLLAGAPAAGATAACLSPGEARQAVASGEALRLGDAARSAGGEILDVQLCDEGGRLVYRLAVMTDGGRVARVLVDARTGERLN